MIIGNFLFNWAFKVCNSKTNADMHVVIIIHLQEVICDVFNSTITFDLQGPLKVKLTHILCIQDQLVQIFRCFSENIANTVEVYKMIIDYSQT